MRKKIKRAIGQCPFCHSTIYVNHPYTWCSDCGERLPQEIQAELPKLDEIRESLATRITNNPDLPDSSATSSMDLIPTRSIILELRDRVVGLRTAAGFIMFGIIFLIFIGILIFLTAGQTAQQEASPALKEVSDIGQTLQRLKSSLDNLSRPATSSQAVPVMDQNTIKTTLERMPFFENTIKESVRDLRQDSGDNRVVIPILVSSVSQRIGIIVLLIFLLQILVPTYRYNLKLAAYYAARADALEILSKLPDNTLDNLIPIFSPDSLNFGRTITSPTDHILEAVKEVIKSARSSADVK